MKKNYLLSGILILSGMTACAPYQQDSIYHPIPGNLPNVTIKALNFNNGQIKSTGEIVDFGPSELLRFGHIWGSSLQGLNFEDGGFSAYYEHPGESANKEPYPFESPIENYDPDHQVYIAAYAINEAGISYSQPMVIPRDIYFARYEILQEQNNDHKINPGETVRLRLVFKSRTPIKIQNPKISNISSLSGYLSGIFPRQDIPLTPVNLSFGVEAKAETEIKVTSNAGESPIWIEVLVVDAANYSYDVKTENGSKIELTIN